jgi:hypothetical protein
METRTAKADFRSRPKGRLFRQQQAALDWFDSQTVFDEFCALEQNLPRHRVVHLGRSHWDFYAGESSSILEFVVALRVLI